MKIAILDAGNMGGTLGRLWGAAGPDGESRDIVQRLIAHVGLRPIRVGENDRAFLVDNLGELWVQLAFRRGLGCRFAFKLMTA